jgi:hypothetical protein
MKLKKGGNKMERTESIVIQVAPSYENTMIKEMEMSGWNLQSRQATHKEGESFGSTSTVSNFNVIKRFRNKEVRS